MKSDKNSNWLQQAQEGYNNVASAVRSLRCGSGLKAKTFRGGAWLGIGSVSEQSLRFLRNMTLARLLAPSAFGMMAIVMSVAALLQAFTELGVQDALIQNPRGCESKYVNAVWWMAFTRGLSAYAILFAIAPFVGRFYGNPELGSLLRIATVGILLEGVMSANAYVALKEMKVQRWAAIYHGGAIVGVITTVILGLMLRNVWALAVGTCAESAFRCLLSYVLAPYLPSFKVDREALRHLLQFSKGLFGLAPLKFIFGRADIFVLGRLVPGAVLGVYSLSIAVAQVPAMFLLGWLNQIFFPALCQIQNDKTRTSRIVLQVTEVVVMLGMPAIVFAYLYGQPLLSLIYGKNYGLLSGTLVLAACGALINIINGLLTCAIFATGAPQLHRRSVAAMAIGMIILVYPLARWLGPIGAQIASLISITIGFFFQLERARHLIGVRFRDYGKIFIRGALVSATGVVVYLVAARVGTITRPLSTVGLGVFGCLAAYGFAAVIMGRRLGFVQRSTEA